MDLKGQTAIITGGGHGLGAAIATVFARSGANVAICGTNSGVLDHQAELLSQTGAKVFAAVCDIRDAAAVSAFVDQVESKLGPIDVLVNNAGGWTDEPLESIDTQALITITDVIVKGSLLASKAVLPSMLRRGKGFILNIGSTSGLASSRDSVAASTPKAALQVFTSTLRRELKGKGIKVAIINPDSIQSQADMDMTVEELKAKGGTSTMQIAHIVHFIVTQPENVLISELNVLPAS